MEFVTGKGAQEAVTAASRSETDGGLIVGGRKIIMNLALDRDQAKQVARDMSKEQDDHDRRHLKLAKVQFCLFLSLPEIILCLKSLCSMHENNKMHF